MRRWLYKSFIYNLVTITHWHFCQVGTGLALLTVSSSNPEEHKPSPLKSWGPTDCNAHDSWEMAVKQTRAKSPQLYLPELCCQAFTTPEDETAQKRNSFSQNCSKTSFSRASTRALCVLMFFAYIFLKPDCDSHCGSLHGSSATLQLQEVTVGFMTLREQELPALGTCSKL